MTRTHGVPYILVAHMIKKMKPACSAYLEKTNPLPSIHFTLETPQLHQGKADPFINHGCTRSWPQLPNAQRWLLVQLAHSLCLIHPGRVEAWVFQWCFGFILYLPFTTFWAFLHLILDVYIFLWFHYNHLVRGLQIMIICSSYSLNVANKVPLRIINNKLGLISTTWTYTTNYNPGCRIWMISPLSNF